MRILIILFIACGIFHCNEADLNFGSDGQDTESQGGGAFKKEYSGNAPNGPYDVIYGQSADGKKFYHQEGPGLEFVDREGDYVQAGLGAEKDYFKIVNGHLILITPPDTTGTGTIGSPGTDTTGTSGTLNTEFAGTSATKSVGTSSTKSTGSAGTDATGSAGTDATGSVGTGVTGSAGTGATGSTGAGGTGAMGTGATEAAGAGTTGSAGTDATGPAGTGVTGSAGTGTTRSVGTGATGTVATGSTPSDNTATGFTFVFDVDLMKDARLAHLLESFPQISEISLELDIDVQRVDLSKIFTKAFTTGDDKNKRVTTPTKESPPKGSKISPK